MSALADLLGRVETAPAPLLAALLTLVGLVSGGLLLRLAHAAPPECRRAWTFIALAALMWNVSNAGLVLGMPAWVLLVVLRPLHLASLGYGITSFPGVARSVRDWLIATADGWMKAGGVAVVAWLVLHDSGIDLAAILDVPAVGLDRAALVWVAVDFAVMSVLGGLLAQAPDRDRRTVNFILASGLLASVGDLTWGVTGYFRIATILWAVTALLISATPLLGGTGVFRTTFVEGGRVRVIRSRQLPLIPAVVFLFAPIQHSWPVTVMAASVVTVVFANVVHHSQANAALLDTVSQQRGQFEALLTDSRDALIQLDGDGRADFVNAAAAQVFGWPQEALIGCHLADLAHPDDRGRAERELAEMRADPAVDAVRIESRVRTATGVWRHVESTVSRRQDRPGLVLSSRDVTARVKLRDELAIQARTDPLTGLLNRSAFLAVVGERAMTAEPAIVLFIDLDGFKAVNDNLGHAAGDRLLQDVATRLDAVAGDRDAVARLGGDEFAVLVDAGVPPVDLAPGVAAFQFGETTAERVIDVIRNVCPPGHPNMRQGVSIGLAVATGQPAEEMLRDADLAMYRAKGAGGGSVVRFEPWMRDRVQERAQLRERLAVAIEDSGLSLALQPVIDLPSRQSGPAGWHGFEALVRWQDGEVRRLPDEFIPLAEESGLVVGLGAWVLRTAVRELGRWPGGEDLTMAVNVSPLQLEKDGFAEDVLRLLQLEGVAPGRLVLEITEQTAVQDLGRTASRLAPLRDRGVHVAIDDFGTGFSSMRYLTRLPVDALKIDRQFVDGLGARRDDEVLVTSMLRLAADLGLDVVAEGVETELQAEILRGHACHLAQGFHFSRPQPIPDLRRIWLESLGLPVLT